MNQPVAEPVESSGIADSSAWQPLPPRARALFLVNYLVPLILTAAVGGALLFSNSRALGAIGGALLGVALGVWLGNKHYRYTFWRLDDEGLALRRGKTWQRETRVPASRVQHLDLKRGPLQRRRALATLVVHTAGTRNSSVTVPNLDAADAERLRDQLSRQIDRDDDEA